MKSRCKASSAIALVIFGTLLLARPVLAGTQDFHFSEFRAVYELDATAGGSVLGVHETLVAEFPNFNQNKGIVREIPRTNQGGKNIVLQDLRMAVLRNGKQEPIWSVEKNGMWFTVSTGTDDYLRGTQRYELFYQFKNVVTDWGSYQELYWDTNGTAWQQRFDSLSATVALPEGVAEDFTGEARCYVGAYGSTNERDCQIEVGADGTEVTFTARRGLKAGENLTLAMKFEPGTFTVPKANMETVYWPLLVAGIVTAEGVGMLAVCLALYRRRVGRPKKLYKPAFTPPEYLPPKGISLAGVAILSDKAAGGTVAAQLLDMAVRGKVRLVEKRPDGQGKLARALIAPKFTVEVLKAEELLLDDRMLLEILGGGGEIVTGRIVDLTPSVGARLGVSTKLQEFAKKTAYKGLAKERLVVAKRPALLRVLGTLQLVVAFMGFAIGIGAMSAAEEIPAIVAHEGLITTMLFGNMLLGIVIMLISGQEWKYAHLTESGWKAKTYLRGLYDYIKLAEAERLKFLQSAQGAERVNVNDKEAVVKLYEKLLPYAVLFGLERSWTKELQRYAGEDYHPNWYAGVGVFHVSNFATALSQFSSTMSANYGAGSSGSSGMSGGSSGGGGGGGGGGGR